jgi:hypothetical protein
LARFAAAGVVNPFGVGFLGYADPHRLQRLGYTARTEDSAFTPVDHRHAF